MENRPFAELIDVCKTYETENTSSGELFTTDALSNITLKLFTSKIYAVLGENGAGKSTLVNILSGFVKPDSGKIIIGGKPVLFNSPYGALKAGIGIVNQEPQLVFNATVLENILLGAFGRAYGEVYGCSGFKTRCRRFFSNLNPVHKIKECKRTVKTLQEQWDVELDLHTKIKTLPSYKKFYTALFTVLCRKPRFLILDEPASVFTEKKRAVFFKKLKTFAKKEKIGIILITHKLKEAVIFADFIYILKKGKLQDTFLTADLAKKEDAENFLKSKIFAHKSFLQEKLLTHNKTEHMETGIAIDLSFYNPTANKLETFKMSAKKGCITGIAAFANSGAEIIEDILSGMFSAQTRSSKKTIFFDGCLYVNKGAGSFLKLSCKKIRPAFLLKHKIGFIPQDRIFRGAAPELTIEEFMNCYRFKSFFFDRKNTVHFIENILKNENINAEKKRTAAALSGGQLQRLILARCLAEKPEIIIASEPMHGLDVVSCELLIQKLRRFADEEKTVIVLTKEFDTAAYKHFFDAVYFLGNEN